MYLFDKACILFLLYHVLNNRLYHICINVPLCDTLEDQGDTWCVLQGKKGKEEDKNHKLHNSMDKIRKDLLILYFSPLLQCKFHTTKEIPPLSMVPI